MAHEKVPLIATKTPLSSDGRQFVTVDTLGMTQTASVMESG